MEGQTKSSYRDYIRNYTPNDNVIKVFGKHGIGDACFAMNISHNVSKTLKEPITLRYYWNWNRDYFHHLDDTENIIDQVDYINKFYSDDNVTIEHLFDCGVKKESFVVENNKLKYGPDPIDCRNCNYHQFDSSLFLPKQQKKVVVWRSTFNSESLQESKKDYLTYDDWQWLIAELKSNGFFVVEIDYRTPVREVFYHINTCSSCICYAGMWYYISANFKKPTLVLSERKITNVHNPCSYQVPKDQLRHIINYYEDYECVIEDYCTNQYKKMDEWFETL